MKFRVHVYFLILINITDILVRAETDFKLPFYFDEVNYVVNGTAETCNRNVSVSDTKRNCRPQIELGDEVTIKWINVPGPNSTVTINWDYECNGALKRDQSIVKIISNQHQNKNISRLKIGDPASVCESKTGNPATLRLHICIKAYTTNDHLLVTYEEEEYSSITTDICTNTYTYIKAAALTSSSGSSVRVGDDYMPSFVFSVSFLAILTVWLFILLNSYRYLIRIRKDFERAALKDRKVVESSRRAMIKRIVTSDLPEVTPTEIKEDMKKFAAGFEKINQFAEEVGKMKVEKKDREDLYGRPPQTRIDKLGRSGFDFGLFLVLVPWRLLSIGNSTLTVGGKGSLYLLPKFVTLKTAYRISIQVFTFLTILAGHVIFIWVMSKRISNSWSYIYGSSGFWMIGGLILCFMLVLRDLSPLQEKGMLKLLRSMGEPKVPEVMFSYSWSTHKDDIRTIARALWSSGIGVWIDAIKLISGDRLPQDIRRAVNEVNLVVVFLTPAYLNSANCCIEFEEAIKHPGKLHVHVLEWDENVKVALKFLIERVKLPKSQISAHGFRNVSFAKIFRSSYRHKIHKSDTDIYIEKLESDGKGWFELAAVLHHYSERTDIDFDFCWWHLNSQSGGGIPNSAPRPPNVESWNLRPIFPLSKIYLPVPGLKFLKLGNVYLRQDCRQTGADGSAIPWKLILLTLCSLSPLGDISHFIYMTQQVRSSADTCANQFRKYMSINNAAGIIALEAICDRFYEKPFYLGEFFTAKNGISAFREAAVNTAFRNVYNDNRGLCNKITQRTTMSEITDAFGCVSELNSWFQPNWDLQDKCTMLTSDELEIFDIEATLTEEKSIPQSSRSPAVGRFRTGSGIPDIPIPKVYVKVHGNSLIADNLRKFLENLDRALPKDACPDIFEYDFADGFTEVPNVDLEKGNAWVNVFVISNPAQLQTYYNLNVEEKIDSDVSVVILDHQPYCEEAENEEILDNSKRETLWVYTVVYIQTRTNGSKKDSAPTSELADQIMVNISLRTKDALFKYGEKYMDLLKEVSSPI
ncbi:hypothetical protein HK098_007668 [Nowakowskiella sp. JEL0407]|nr:hypothetical protein HK098_007668 [Nowakowskiella sp. JEL0407]